CWHASCPQNGRHLPSEPSSRVGHEMLNPAANLPTFRVYSAAPHAGGKDQRFEIGLAYPQPDGKGFVIVLQEQPSGPQVVLRAPPQATGADKGPSLAQQVEAFERAVIERCLLEAGGKVSAVMKRLDIPRRTLSEK